MAMMSLQAAYDQARSYLEANQVEQAIGVAQHILEHFPENLEAHRILGEAYLASRQFDLAEAAFGQVLHADPENIPAHVGLGITLERQGKLDRAVAEFEQALEVRPDMPELRGQLLRLYTDLWGAEGATLRLSRPGLARLYAKGHMLPQAIQEFRSVIDEHPDRFDARVGLAEALWRDGQEDAAAETCEGILAERPAVLKANLLLGYIRLAAGDESGEPYWRLAQQLDPYQGVARSLFETLPDVPPPDLELPQWDETAWLTSRAREEEQRRAGGEGLADPALAAGAAAGAVAMQDEDSFGSWIDQVDQPLDEYAVDAPAAVPETANDDFLASLLALDTPPVPVDEGSELDSSSGVTPFSFDELDAGLVEAEGRQYAEMPSPMPDAEGSTAEELEPFSLEDLGLSDAEIAQLGESLPSDEVSEATGSGERLSFDAPGPDAGEMLPDVPAAAAEGEALEPFTLEDLGLTPEEIAELNAQLPAEEAAPMGAAGNPELESLEPFSLDDLGLSPEELATTSPQAAPAEAGAPDLEPFALDDLGLSPAELASLGAATGAAAMAGQQAERDEASDSADAVDEFDSDLGDLQPFSLDDLDLNALGEEPVGGLPPSLQGFSLEEGALPAGSQAAFAGEGDESAEAQGGYSWQQPAAKPQTDFGRDAESDTPQGNIFNRLRQQAAERPPEEELPLPPVSDDDAEAAGYFSNDDVALRDDEPHASDRFAGGFRLPKEGEAGLPAGAIAAGAGAVAGAAAAGALSGRDEEPPADETTAQAGEDEPALTPFSLEDLGLSPEEIAQLEAATGAAGEAPTASDEPALTPFSLEDLGLSPEEIAQLEAATGVTGEVPTASDEPPVGVSDEPALTPFSLEDLGLSPEEIAQLEAATGAAGEAPTASDEPPVGASDEPELTPFSLEDLGLSPEEIAQLEAATGELPPPMTGETIVPGWSHGEEPELTPFSSEEAGELSGLEPFSLDDLEAPPAQSAAGGDTIDETVGIGVEPFSLDDFDFDAGEGPGQGNASLDPNVRPFSLDDLGLGENGAGEDPSRELGLTAEELAGLDLGELESLIGDPNQTTPLVSDDPAAALERLMELGRAQGYVDLTDIISLVSDPEAEAERIEEMGWALHNAGIEIRDGDEVIDMEAEEQADESLELAGEPLELATAPAEVVGEGEPDLTPFSLSDLGLSDDEIAALGLAEGTATGPSEPAAPPALSADEPELTPFSLEDLGLSPEEIAMLEGAVAEEETSGAEAPAEPAPPAEAAPSADEPELTPFSLEDLGLSPEEIAMLEGAVAEEEAAPEASDDPFDFSAVEAQQVETVTRRTEPRAEEPPPPVDPADAAFVAEPLDSLDDIWQESPAAPAVVAGAVAAGAAAEATQRGEAPARVVLPPLGERTREPAPAPEARRGGRGMSRDDERYARREEAIRRSRDDERYARRDRREAARWRELPPEPATPAPLKEFAGFLPTGDAILDDYLGQLDNEPDNYGLALAIGRLCAQTGRPEVMALAFKRLVRAGEGVPQLTEELEGLVGTTEDQQVKRQLYRLLGDAYSKQGRYKEAMSAYSTTFGR